MRILAAMDSRAFFGAERANLDILRRMHECGAEVTALVRDEDWPENLRMRAELDKRGITWIKAPFPDYLSWRYKRYWPKVFMRNPYAFARLNAIAVRTIREYGITNFHLGTPFQAFSLALALARTGVPLTVFCVEKPGGHNWFFRSVWRWLARRADGFVCESRHIRAGLVGTGVDPKKIAIIRTSPPHRFIATPFEINSFQDAKGDIVFGFVGQFTAHKGIAVLLDAFSQVAKRYPNARLLIAGPTDEPFARSLVEQWSGFRNGKLISFCGPVEDIPSFFAACDVHVAPTIGAEPYGLVVVEAKQAGRPSIVFNDGGMVELIAPGQDGLVAQAKTAAALAEQMLVYARDRERARAHGAHARASLTERLEIDQQDEKWLQAYAAAKTSRDQVAANRRVH